jgi:hypothetical protein
LSGRVTDRMPYLVLFLTLFTVGLMISCVIAG